MSNTRFRAWGFVILLLLLAWGTRLCSLEEVPPGWRDDELINIHALSNRVLQGEFPIYYLGASGHEPLYHHLHAGVLALFGFNVLSGHVLSVAFGMLSVALTYTLVRRLFPRTRVTAGLAALTLAISFWSLMYSRTAIRHISLPPFVLATIYVFWRCLESDRFRPGHWILSAVLLSASLYTYTASRLLPVLLLLFIAYLLVMHPDWLRGRGRGIVIAFIVVGLLTAPLVIAIARGRSRRAIEGIGADARVTELAGPLRALRRGDPRPLVSSVVTTLGMFHASGDPEWLYNIRDRPVFNLFGGLLLWLGVGLSLYRWREPRYFVLLPWLGLGLAPAFISTPPASLSHTMFAQPVAYILPSLALVELSGWLASRPGPRMSETPGISWQVRRAGIYAILAAFVVTNGLRDVRDYFVVWPARGMVRLLYRADQREIADYLNDRPEITNLAVGSALMGPWDRIALEVDVERQDVAVRLFNPERALVWAAGDDGGRIILPSWPEPSPTIAGYLGAGRDVSRHLTLHLPPHPISSESLVTETSFANGLILTHVHWVGGERPAAGEEGNLLTSWHVSAPLDLPPMPVVAQPPPPETYSGARLAVFAHLLAGDGKALDVDDGLWVDPLTLQPGDRFVQVHRLAFPSDASAQPHAVALGLYDPKTNERWDTLASEGGTVTDLVSIPLGERP